MNETDLIVLGYLGFIVALAVSAYVFIPQQSRCQNRYHCHQHAECAESNEGPCRDQSRPH